MKHLILLLGFILIASFGYSQEYDDMYFNKRDRKKPKKENYSNRKHINPEYIARYTTKPKVKVVVQSYHRPYRYNYNSWNFHVGFNSWYDPFYSPFYSPYYPYYAYNGWYDPFYRWNRYGYYPPYYSHYGWNYGYPRHYGYYGSNYHYYNPHYSYYGSNYYYGHNHSYYTKTYATKHKSEVKYQKRTPRGTNYNATRKTNYDRRTVDNSRIRIPETRLNKDVRNNRISTYTDRPSSRPKANTSRATQYRSTYKPSNSYQNKSRSSSSYSTPSRSKSSYTPSRSSAPSRSYSPSRSSGGSRSPSSTGTRSSSSGSRGRRQ